jgi:DNA-binding NarL/FixJ family response regulator
MDTDKIIVFNETNSGELTPQQEAAVAMILDGKSDGEISELLKMRRQTVNEWRNHHTAFRLEVKLRRDQVLVPCAWAA